MQQKKIHNTIYLVKYKKNYVTPRKYIPNTPRFKIAHATASNYVNFTIHRLKGFTGHHFRFTQEVLF